MSREPEWPGATAAWCRGECRQPTSGGMGTTQGRGATRQESCLKQWLSALDLSFFLFSQRLKAGTCPATT